MRDLPNHHVHQTKLKKWHHLPVMNAILYFGSWLHNLTGNGIWKNNSLSLQQYCGGESMPFVSGSKCTIGVAYWLAVAGTVATCISSSLAIWAYQSTKSMRSVILWMSITFAKGCENTFFWYCARISVWRFPISIRFRTPFQVRNPTGRGREVHLPSLKKCSPVLDSEHKSQAGFYRNLI